MTLTLTGAQLYEMLKQQRCTQDSARVLLPSVGVHYTWDQSLATALLRQPCASGPNPVTDLSIGGVAVDPAASYRVTDRLGGEVDTDALEKYVAPSLSGAAIAPLALDRIDVVP